MDSLVLNILKPPCCLYFCSVRKAGGRCLDLKEVLCPAAGLFGRALNSFFCPDKQIVKQEVTGVKGKRGERGRMGYSRKAQFEAPCDGTRGGHGDLFLQSSRMVEKDKKVSASSSHVSRSKPHFSLSLTNLSSSSRRIYTFLGDSFTTEILPAFTHFQRVTFEIFKISCACFRGIRSMSPMPLSL